MGENKSIDYLILFILIVFFIISLITVYSGTGQYTDGQSFHFALRQLIWYTISFALMIGVSRFDYELLENWAVYLYIFGMMLLLYVRFFGVLKNGSQRWIDLTFMEFQPSELMKVFLVIYLAAMLKKNGKKNLSFSKSIPVVFKAMAISIFPFYFILKQPDLGSAILIAITSIGLVLTSTISSKMITLIFTVIASSGSFLIYLFTFHEDVVTNVFQTHQLGRIYSWLSPSDYSDNFGYQVKNAMLGIGAGQLNGSGFSQGVQVQSGRVPEAHTDFIFAVIGEEFGFMGSSLLVLLFFLLIYRIITIALRTDNIFGTYICVGVILLIGFQVFQNIGMTIGLMPVTGIALPFISYGGSALMTNLFALGLVQSIDARSKNYIFFTNTE
ncbi:rod shape-determining protein RodA [Gracilibacillus caseinilyticus]|uniref:Rod shape-determining protein RodA n=1 Tax=Gracilibacillus caseinilyticus TaxID=2932256 RepID=A0ABY4F2V9_9BACI|nr:rod shape-determining protein RodA [Gracilibacillus caseinilyticus]UOQ50402.1 rod shape-determining protein RodA [Gracilibacillus caseinilyticus]